MNNNKYERRIACDGPSNGDFLTTEQAQAQGYVGHVWMNDEPVWVLPAVLMEQGIDPDPVGSAIEKQIAEGIDGVEISRPSDSVRLRYRRGS